jgi:hypothetical protein
MGQSRLHWAGRRGQRVVEVVDKYFIQHFFVHNLLEGLIILP